MVKRRKRGCTSSLGFQPLRSIMSFTDEVVWSSRANLNAPLCFLVLCSHSDKNSRRVSVRLFASMAGMYAGSNVKHRLLALKSLSVKLGHFKSMDRPNHRSCGTF